jgi:hypothetical protein
VFLSHHNSDLATCEWIKTSAALASIDVYLYEHDHQPGASVSEKVLAEIRACDAFVVFWTQRSQMSQWVNQEIGTARGADKLIIPVVQRGVGLGGYLTSDIEYVELDFFTYDAAINQLLARIERLAVAKQEVADKRNRGLALAGLIGAGLLMFAASGDGEDEDEAEAAPPPS